MNLIDYAFEDAPLDGELPAQSGMGAGAEDQLSKKWGDMDNGASSPGEAAETRKDVECAHVGDSGDGDRVRSVGGNPDGAEGRNDPRALRRFERHDALGGEEELVFRMGMLGNAVAMR